MRTLVLAVAHEPRVRSFMTEGPGRALARRFVAGETLDDGFAAAQRLGEAGARVSLDYLGESVGSFADAEAALAVYRATTDRLRGFDAPVSLSVKPSQLAVELSRERCFELLVEVVDAARTIPAAVRLDMEDSSHTDDTLWLARRLRERDRPVGVVLQASLYRTPADLELALAAGLSVRLCKGAYAEPRSIAYPRKSDVDAAYGRLLETLIARAAGAPAPGVGQLPIAAIATHDQRLILRARELIERMGVDRTKYEFQMLYGVRRDLQQWLLAREYPLRVYTPWGPSWYPYLTRRLAERPANLLFFASSLASELVAGKPATHRGRRDDGHREGAGSVWTTKDTK
ncbi:MAG: proline dehydrogenase family protein [Chloroflexota bacterium]